jgi:chorismate mutase
VSGDRLVDEIRAEISDVDTTILDAINTRLRLVARLKRYKDSQGMEFLDPEREAQLLDTLAEANSGPLSEAGLRELYEKILDLTKREVGR